MNELLQFARKAEDDSSSLLSLTSLTYSVLQEGYHQVRLLRSTIQFSKQASPSNSTQPQRLRAGHGSMNNIREFACMVTVAVPISSAFSQIPKTTSSVRNFRIALESISTR